MLPFRVVQTTRNLHEIGLMSGTDKSDGHHTWFGKSYMHRYASYFDELRNQPVKFLEIGVLNGASLRAWRNFFPNGEIHGIDIRPECKVHEDRANGIFVHIVDCSIVDELESFKSKFRNYFDVILDDGSHVNDITLKTFYSLYDCVKPVGYYMIEDLGCSYITHSPHEIQGWPGLSITKELPHTNTPESMLDLYKQIHAMIDTPCETNKYQIEFLHHYTFIIVLRKNERYLHERTIYSKGAQCESHVHTILRNDA